MTLGKKAQAMTQEVQEGHGTGVTIGEYILATLVPCYICCEARGAAVGASKNKLVGMEAVMEYIISCKDANVRYAWTIQNYHYETRTRTVSDGNGGTRTETYQERVNTHFASTGGELASMDTTPTFQPNMRKSNVALSCSLKTPEFDEKFAPEYSRRKHHFYCANTTDSHQDKSESFQLLPMRKAVHVKWVDTGSEPWYVDSCARNVAALTFTAACWLKAMDSYMGMQKVAFSKKCGAFL